MTYSLRDRIRDYRSDPFFPTALVLAVWFGIRDHVRAQFEGSFYYRGDGQPRWYKPSNFPNPVSWAVNRSLFNPSNSGPRDLTRFERVALWLGF